MDTAVTKPLSQRINFRVVVFVTILVLPVAYLLYFLISGTLNRGIRPGSDGTLEVDLKAMSNFEMDQAAGNDKAIPQQWRGLNGKKVRLVGEMYSSLSAREAREFDLVWSISKCCVTPNPKIQHFVKSTLKDKAIPVYGGLVEVVGTLHVGVERSDPKSQAITSVYRLEVERVTPTDERSGWFTVAIVGVVAVLVLCWVFMRLLRSRA